MIADPVLALVRGEHGSIRAEQLLAQAKTKRVVDVPQGLRGAIAALRALLTTPHRTVYIIDINLPLAFATLVARSLRRRVVVDTGDLVYALGKSVGNRSMPYLVLVYLAERAVLRSATALVVRGGGHLAHLPQDTDVTVIPDLAPPGAEPVSGAPARRSLKLENKFVVGIVGSLVYAPNLDRSYGWDLIEALAETPENIHGLIVGDGTGMRRLQGRARDLGVSGRLRFTGRVPSTEVAEYIGAMNVALSTQTNDAVGEVRTTGKLPLYLACGCPVLASHVGEAARLLGPLGWTLPYSGVTDRQYPRRLARAITELSLDLNGEEERRATALNLSNTAFGEAEMRERLAALLRRLASSSHTP